MLARIEKSKCSNATRMERYELANYYANGLIWDENNEIKIIQNLVKKNGKVWAS